MSRPLDPRLLREAGAARSWVGLVAGLGVVTTGLVVTQAVLLARVIAGVVMEGDDLTDHRAAVIGALVVAVTRALLAGAQERFGHRAATRVVRQLRERVLRHALAGVTRRGVVPCAPQGAALTTLTTRGLDGLEGYLTKYLPQLLLASILTPAVLAVILWEDRIAGLTVLFTLPLIPLFMALVGLSSQASADRSLRTLQSLGAQLLDLVAGIPTLQAHERAPAAVRRIRFVGDAYRRATMKTLRSAFLSALVLETLTTLSVALVAVGIGLRLVTGELDLRTGLTVLLLAPEVYLPLRMVGVHYHASVDGLAAASQALTALEAPVSPPGLVTAPDLRTTSVRLQGLSVVYPGSDRATPGGLDVVVSSGQVVALTGPSGGGKSTAVAALLGLVPPSSGRVLVGDVDLAGIEPASWWKQVAWVPQHPALVPGTLAENVRLYSTGVTEDRIAVAAARTGLDAVVTAKGGWDARIGSGGTGLSAGERQRLALTRVLLGSEQLVVLDEPTAHLDATSEETVLRVLSDLRAAGRTVVLVAHRPALAAAADRCVQVTPAVATASTTELVPVS